MWLAILLSIYAALMACAIGRGFCRKQAVLMCALASISGLALWIEAAGWLVGALAFVAVFAGAGALGVRLVNRIWPPARPA